MTEFEKNVKAIRAFKNMIEGRLTHAFNETDRNNFTPFDTLQENMFTLSFMGKSCKIYFGAFEYDAITIMIEKILEEYNE